MASCLVAGTESTGGIGADGTGIGVGFGVGAGVGFGVGLGVGSGVGFGVGFGVGKGLIGTTGVIFFGMSSAGFTGGGKGTGAIGMMLLVTDGGSILETASRFGVGASAGRICTGAVGVESGFAGMSELIAAFLGSRVCAWEIARRESSAKNIERRTDITSDTYKGRAFSKPENT